MQSCIELWDIITESMSNNHTTLEILKENFECHSKSFKEGGAKINVPKNISFQDSLETLKGAVVLTKVEFGAPRVYLSAVYEYSQLLLYSLAD